MNAICFVIGVSVNIVANLGRFMTSATCVIASSDVVGSQYWVMLNLSHGMDDCF